MPKCEYIIQSVWIVWVESFQICMGTKNHDICVCFQNEVKQCRVVTNFDCTHCSGQQPEHMDGWITELYLSTAHSPWTLLDRSQHCNQVKMTTRT